MNERLLAPVREYYRGKLREHGPGAEGMDWKDRASQYLRFDRIVARLDWSTPISILDVGCGSGELLAYVRERALPLERYLGIDIVEEMVESCLARFGPGSARRATVHDLIRDGERFDYVVASGTFNVKLGASDKEWRTSFYDALVAMFAGCRKGIAFNVMSAYVDRRYEHLYYASPEELVALAVGRLSRSFVIDHSYPLFELTMAVHRR